jgi:hypothetical protein
MEITRSRDKYFDDVANYLITLVSMTLAAELYVTGKAGRFAANHIVQLDAKQAGKRLMIYPYTLLNDVFALRWPTKLVFDEEPVEIPPSKILKLDALERPLYALEQSMFVNYFERERPSIETKYGENTTAWPDDWNFARVVRNSVAHKNAVFFRNPCADPVSWRGLTYSPADNGRRVLNGDLWAADLIYLMMDLDAHLR